MLKLGFPKLNRPYFATICDRPRISGLTSVRWLPNGGLVCCDFNERAIYLLARTPSGFRFVDVKPTVTNNGMAVQTDLLDVRGNLCVVTNFFQGSISFYRLVQNQIVFWKELNLNDFKGAHGVRFIPGHEHLVWVSYCDRNNKCFQIIDFESEKILQTIETEEQAQDVAFIDGYAVLFARTPHISEGIVDPPTDSPRRVIYATAYLYGLPKNIQYETPKLLHTWRGEGHLDAAKEFRGLVFGANQYLDRIDVFAVRNETLHRISTIPGFDMPHGLDINKRGELAVTNYGDQSLRVASLPLKRNKQAVGQATER